LHRLCEQYEKQTVIDLLPNFDMQPTAFGRG
jgi:hypothetical protein